MNQPSPFWRWLAHKLEPFLRTPAASAATPVPAPATPSTNLTVNISTGIFTHTPAAPLPQPEAPAPTAEQLRELMGQALSMPTPDAIFSFVDFAHRMRKMGPYNILMVYAQRPGALAVASREDWAKVGQTVRPDAIPILILRPKGPISQVFELLDTLPVQVRDPRVDAFGATGEFDEARLKSVIDSFKTGKRKLRVQVIEETYGTNLAGQISAIGMWNVQNETLPLAGATNHGAVIERVAPDRWSIKLNRQLTPAEKYATLMHELGHLFCGHLGPFNEETPEADEYGWPDRRNTPHAAREIEAELVAWHMCDREGLVTGSPLYLRPYLEKAKANGELAKVDLDRVIRAIARIRMHAGERKPQTTIKARPVIKMEQIDLQLRRSEAA